MTKLILKCLDDYCDFNDDLTQDTFESHIVEPLQQAHCFPSDWRWDYNSGCTKGVLIFYNLHIVIKIPFSGESRWEDAEYRRKNDDEWASHTEAHSSCGHLRSNYYKCEGGESLIPFCGAYYGNGEQGWDYCKAEEACYISAVKGSVEQFFAKTYLIGYAGADAYPIYAQELCDTFDEAYSSDMEDYATRAKSRTKDSYTTLEAIQNSTGYACRFDKNWGLDCLLYFGEDIFIRFLDFCQNYGVKDLHNGNIGYLRGKPVLIDYSGYNN